MPTDIWMHKEDVVHRHTMEYYSATKMNEIMPSASVWMQLEMITLGEVSQKEEVIPYVITYTRNLKYDTHEPTYKAEVDWQTQRTDVRLPRGEGQQCTGSSGLAGADGHTQDGWAPRSCCITQGTTADIRWQTRMKTSMCIHMHNNCFTVEQK